MVEQFLNILDIVEKMTLEEKAALVNGATFFGMAQIERLGIPRLQLLDGGTGMNFEQLFGDFYSQLEKDTNSTNGMMGSTTLTKVIENYYTPDKLQGEEKEVYQWIKTNLEERVGSDYAPGCFPSGMLLGATFNKKIVHAIGQALGAEARLFGVDILLGSPNVNIHRDPLNGRLFEGYSEDPCLVSQLAPELVKGVQEYNVAANVKHFAANNQETNRVGINETISERALHEIYLPGFKACVKEGQVQTVMSAYNGINGTPCTENYWLLTKELRENWGFEGSVISDWGAVYHPVEAIQAGNDLAMPGPISAEPIIEAVGEGKLSEEVLNQAVERLLRTIQYCRQDVLGQKQEVRIGECTVPLTKASDGKQVFLTDALLEATRKAAYEAAVEGIVLLKNEKRAFPLKKDEKILLLGSGSERLLECGTGSAGIHTNRTSDLVEELRTVLGSDSVIVHSDCSFISDDENYLDKNGVGHIIYIAKVGGMEGNDRKDLELEKEDLEQLLQLKCLKKQYSFRLTLVLNVCGPIDFSEVSDALDAVFVCFLPGMEGGHALADLMTGKRNPSGKLPLTFPKHYEDTPTFLNFPGEGYEVNYGEGIYVGYRYYDKKKVLPAYPFGFGLSYTTFELKDFQIEEECFTDNLHFSIGLKNKGALAGSEVIQIYISDVCSTLPKPVKELKAFEKIFLEPGEEKKIGFKLTKEQFASYDSDFHCWIAEEGYYDIIAAVSSDLKTGYAVKRVYLQNHTPYSYGMDSTIKVLYEHDQLKEHLYQLWKEKNWDWQIIESNYQYTPNRKLLDVLPENCGENDKNILNFIECIQWVKKK
ncbi:MAG: glycoside hydrolase family 3 C-terminal domain-containing protein [Lachnospiraceae bacterium]|nr:glycoside hydrolase family 3 C-terminal domain-containing protein [Lachnospiraceae bacterium]